MGFNLVLSRALILGAAVALPACEVNLNSEGIVSRETKTFKVAGVPDLHLETFDGSIEVHSWDRDEVEIEIERRAMEQSLIDEMKVSAEQNGDKIVVKVTRPGGREFDGVTIGVHFSPSARLRVIGAMTMRLGSSSEPSEKGRNNVSTEAEDIHGAFSCDCGPSGIYRKPEVNNAPALP